MDERPVRTTDDGPPPFFASWRTLYALVIALLVLIIFGLYLFSAHFS
jgi:hypothetical protein